MRLIKSIFIGIKRRFDRWAVRKVLCHKMHLKRGTPDIVLRYLALSSGDEQLRRFAGLLDK